MSKPTAKNIQWGMVFFIACIFISGCKNFNSAIPFPADETEYSKTVSRPFKFSEAKKIEWAITDPDSIKSFPEKKFDFNQLPAKPFDIGEPKPLLKPLSEQKFDIDALPDTVFNYDKLPTQKLKFITKVLGAPKMIKAGLFAVKPGTSRGILEAGINIGLPGLGKCFVLDKYGMMWIGTDKGLCRYDGENMEVYSNEQGITDANIFSIFKDDKEQIWTGTATGEVFILNRRTGLLKQLADTFKRGTIFSITKDTRGKIWLSRTGNLGGAYIIDEEKETIKQLSIKEGLLDNNVFRTIQDQQGRTWSITGGGLTVIDPASGKTKKIPKSTGLSGTFYLSIFQDNKGRIWLGGDGGVDIIDLKLKNIKHLWKDQGIEPSKFICGLMQDKAGNMWIGSDTGTVYTFDEKNNLLQKLNVNIGPFNDVYNFLEDAGGQLWMGSIRGSSYIFNSRNGRPASITKNEGLGDNNVWNVFKHSSGSIWIGTFKGIDIYDPQTKTIKHLGKEQGLINERNTDLIEDNQKQVWSVGNNIGISIIDIQKGTVKQFGHAQGLNTNNDCSSILYDKKGQVWIGGGDGELLVINPVEKLVKKISNTPQLKGTGLFSLQQDSKGQIWVGGLGSGVEIINPDENTIMHLGTKEGLISNDVTTFTEDAEGKMWIGTVKGIEIADVKNNTLTSITTNEGLPAADIYTINAKENKVYVGTSVGLSILTSVNNTVNDKKYWKIQTIGKTEGLTNADVAENSSMLTKEGQWWAGAENAILAIVDEPNADSNTTTPYVTGINVMDKPQFFSNGQLQENDLKNIDTLWKTDKNSFYPNKQLPIDTGYLQKNKIHWDSIGGPYNLPLNLHLPFDQNYLSFTFNGTHTNNPDKEKYRYILEGIDKNWSAITNKKISENYRDLPPGHYNFKVSSKGMNDLWSVPTEFKFTILPPWWKTWWAYLGYVLLFLGALRIFSKWRERNLRYEKEKLELKVNHRTKQLQESIENLKATQTQLIQSEKMASLGELTAGIAHEIQNPLNFVNNFSEVNSELIAEMKQEIDNGNLNEVKAIANSINENEQKIIFHGKRADSIVKGMLQHSRSSSGVKEPTDINALADEYLRLAYHGLRAKDKSFNATMKTDFDKSIGNINIITQDIGRVILNLITNAFYVVDEKKKSGIENYEPTVSVSTKKVADHVLITVKDNGNGIPQKVLDKIFQPFFTTKPAGQGTGLGLSLSYDIVKAHGGELKVETKEEEGSTFIIQLPIM
jgi:signal transduction histidine kinase/streptogramin lyase